MKKNAKQGVAKQEKKVLRKANRVLSAEKSAIKRVPTKGKPGRAKPIAVGHTNKTRTAKVKTKSEGTFVSHTEFLYNLSGSGAPTNNVAPFDLISRRINPGLSQTFPWLCESAKNYTNYRVKRMKFRYVPLCPTTVKGSVTASINYDSTMKYPTTDIELRQELDSKAFSPFDPTTIFFRPRVIVTTTYNIAGDLSPAPNDPDAPTSYRDINLVDAGVLHFVTNGVYDEAGGLIPVIGAVYVDYVIELLVPNENSTVQQDLQLALYTDNAYNSSPFHGYDDPNNGFFETTGSLENPKVVNDNNTSSVTFTCYAMQPLSFSLAMSSPPESVIMPPTLSYNGETLTPGVDYNFYVVDDQTPNLAMMVGQVMTLPQDVMDPNVFTVNATNSAGLSNVRLNMWTTWFPFKPINALFQGALSTIPEKLPYRIEQNLKKNKFDKAEVQPEPIKFRDNSKFLRNRQNDNERAKNITNDDDGEYGFEHLTPVKLANETSRDPNGEIMYTMTLGDKYDLPSNRLSDAMDQAMKRREEMKKIPSTPTLPRPRLFSAGEAMKQAMSYSSLVQKYPWFEICDEPLRMPQLASVLTDAQLKAVGAAMGSKQSSTFDEILDTVSKVTEIGTKIFSLLS